MKTQKERRTELVLALRSGNYAQIRSRLRKNAVFTSNIKACCCLGVACDLIDPDAWKKTEMDEWAIGFHTINLPDEIADEYGFVSSTGSFTTDGLSEELFNRLKVYNGHLSLLLKTHKQSPNHSHNLLSLATLNDAGVPFSLIADIIEAEPFGMFDDYDGKSNVKI